MFFSVKSTFFKQFSTTICRLFTTSIYRMPQTGTVATKTPVENRPEQASITLHVTLIRGNAGAGAEVGYSSQMRQKTWAG